MVWHERGVKGMKDIQELAKAHSKWCSGFFEWVYEQAFIHGYKHGKEER